MRSLSPSLVQELVTKAFVIEAITDKPGCTTRYIDLPGKPLQDFIIAGINSSEAFRLFAQGLIDNPKTPIFEYNLSALKTSNKHKSGKYINFGLLEIMFPAVAARMAVNDEAKVIDKVIELVKKSPNADVRHILETRRLAWSTSDTSDKISFRPSRYKDLASVWDFYMALAKDFSSGSSASQWADQFKQGLPILREFFDAYQERNEILDSTKSVFTKQKAINPKVAVGIIADMCAAAIFLWLSFNESSI